MPSTLPRINVVLEAPLLEAVADLARRDGTSLSRKARDLILHAVALEEDAALEALVLERKRRNRRFLTHAEIRRRAGLK